MPEPPDVEAPPTDRPAPEPTPPWDPLADEALPDVPGLGSLKYHYNGHKKFQKSFYSSAGFFSPFLRFQEQQNFRIFEFRREILEFSEKSFHFDGGNLEFPLSLEEKFCFLAKTPWV